MSHVYPTFKTKLFDWAFSAPPANMSWRLAIAGPGFVHSAVHQTIGSVADVLGDDIELSNVSYTNGRLRADDLGLQGLDVGDTIKAIIIYLKFDGGTQLILNITESENEPLPITLLGNELAIRWDDQGIAQL